MTKSLYVGVDDEQINKRELETRTKFAFFSMLGLCRFVRVKRQWAMVEKELV
jgi:hypothetical protein